jgi:hypothetical protein
MAVIVHADVDRRPDQETGNIFNRLLGAIAHQSQKGGVEQFFGIGAAADTPAHFSDQVIPKLPVYRNIGHCSPEQPGYTGARYRRQICARPTAKANVFRASIMRRTALQHA